MTDHFFNFLLQSVESRVAPVKNNTRYLLDKNEQSDDIDMELKKKVLESLLQANWNRYPVSDYIDIEAKIAAYCKLQAENIVLSAGSASIITTLLDFFALNQKKIVIAQPTYSLFDYHCKTYNIAYQPWYLTPDLEFDFDNLPELDSNSVFIITSPNNPVGNTIDVDKLEFLLQEFPKTLIILDAVYCEFSNTDFTPFIKKYENLIVLRSFSKAFPIAGLRLGYLCASAQTAAVIKKLILQFSITNFSLLFARELLFNEEFMENSRSKVKTIIAERERLYYTMTENYRGDILHVYPSRGNFLLIRIFDDSMFEKLMNGLTGNGIKILNTSNFPLLKNTFRVSIGNVNENEVFLECLAKYIMPKTARESSVKHRPILQPLSLATSVLLPA